MFLFIVLFSFYVISIDIIICFVSFITNKTKIIVTTMLHVFKLFNEVFLVCCCFNLFRKIVNILNINSMYTYTNFVYVYMYIFMYVYIHTHTYIHTFIHTYVRTYVRTCIHTYIHTIHTCIHQYIHTHTHTCIHTYINTYIHLFIRCLKY